MLCCSRNYSQLHPVVNMALTYICSYWAPWALEALLALACLGESNFHSSNRHKDSIFPSFSI